MQRIETGRSPDLNFTPEQVGVILEAFEHLLPTTSERAYHQYGGAIRDIFLAMLDNSRLEAFSQSFKRGDLSNEERQTLSLLREQRNKVEPIEANSNTYHLVAGFLDERIGGNQPALYGADTGDRELFGSDNEYYLGRHLEQVLRLFNREDGQEIGNRLRLAYYGDQLLDLQAREPITKQGVSSTAPLNPRRRHQQSMVIGPEELTGNQTDYEREAIRRVGDVLDVAKKLYVQSIRSGTARLIDPNVFWRGIFQYTRLDGLDHSIWEEPANRLGPALKSELEQSLRERGNSKIPALIFFDQLLTLADSGQEMRRLVSDLSYAGGMELYKPVSELLRLGYAQVDYGRPGTSFELAINNKKRGQIVTPVKLSASQAEGFMEVIGDNPVLKEFPERLGERKYDRQADLYLLGRVGQELVNHLMVEPQAYHVRFAGQTRPENIVGSINDKLILHRVTGISFEILRFDREQFVFRGRMRGLRSEYGFESRGNLDEKSKNQRLLMRDDDDRWFKIQTFVDETDKIRDWEKEIVAYYGSWLSQIIADNMAQDAIARGSWFGGQSKKLFRVLQPKALDLDLVKRKITFQVE